MTNRLHRRLALAGLTLVLAVPATADAQRKHGDNGLRGDARACAALKAGDRPRSLTEEQVQQLVAACDTYAAAVAAAAEAFTTDTRTAADAHRAVRKQARTDFAAARDEKRAACEPDPEAQACIDARAAFRQTVRDLRTKVREAFRAHRRVTGVAARTRRDAVRAARTAFRAEVSRIRGA